MNYLVKERAASKRPIKVNAEVFEYDELPLDAEDEEDDEDWEPSPHAQKARSSSTRVKNSSTDSLLKNLNHHTSSSASKRQKRFSGHHQSEESESESEEDSDDEDYSQSTEDEDPDNEIEEDSEHEAKPSESYEEDCEIKSKDGDLKRPTPKPRGLRGTQPAGIPTRKTANSHIQVEKPEPARHIHRSKLKFPKFTEGKFSSVSQEEQTGWKFGTVINMCFVCLQTAHSGAPLLRCARCLIEVHQNCYGVKSDEAAIFGPVPLPPSGRRSWYCEPCKAKATTILCLLCPYPFGAFKQTELDGQWVHAACALYGQDVSSVDRPSFSPVVLSSIPPKRWGSKECNLCLDKDDRKYGVLIPCDAGLCKASFHATCAQREGLLDPPTSQVDEHDETSDAFLAHCKVHCESTASKLKKGRWRVVDSFFRYSGFKQVGENFNVAEYAAACEDYQKVRNFQLATLDMSRSISHRAAVNGVMSSREDIDYMLDLKNRGVPSLSVSFVRHYQSYESRIEKVKAKHESRLLEHNQLKVDLEACQNSIEDSESVLNGEKAHHRIHFRALQKMTKLFQAANCLPRDSSFPFVQYLAPYSEPPTKLQQDALSSSSFKILRCRVCSGADHPQLLALCDTCHQRVHVHCHDPPLLRLPRKSKNYGWQCSECEESFRVESSTSASSSKRTRTQKPLYQDDVIYI